MSLINNYLKVTEEEGKLRGKSGGVPPVLISGKKRGGKRGYLVAAALLLTGVVGYQAYPELFKVIGTGKTTVAQTGAEFQAENTGAAEQVQTVAVPPITVSVSQQENSPAPPPDVAPVAAVQQPLIPAETGAEKVEAFSAPEPQPVPVQEKKPVALAPVHATGQRPAADVQASVQSPEVVAPVAALPESRPVIVTEKAAQATGLPDRITSYLAEMKPLPAPTPPPKTGRRATTPAAAPEVAQKVELDRPQAVAESAVPEPVAPDSSKTEAERYYQIGQVAQQEGDLKAAEYYYLATLKQLPASLDTLINLSAVYLQQQKYEPAAEVLKKILALDSRNTKARVNLGVIDLEQGRSSEAKENFKAVLAVSPQNEEALSNLAYLAQQEGDVTAAGEYFSRLLEIAPENPDVLLAFSSMLEQEGRFAEAIGYYRQCLKIEAVRHDSLFQAKIKKRIKVLESYR